MSLGIWETHVVLIAYASHMFFLIALIKKICDSHMLKGHMSLLHVGCKKFMSKYKCTKTSNLNFSLYIYINNGKLSLLKIVTGGMLHNLHGY
jgi:hypothetical protein